MQIHGDHIGGAGADPYAILDDDEVERWKQKDPIDRLEAFLLDTGRLDAERIDAIESANRDRMADAVETAEAAADEPPTAMFDDVYAEPTPDLDAQRASLQALRKAFGDDALLED